jgi:hypothetical protein
MTRIQDPSGARSATAGAGADGAAPSDQAATLIAPLPEPSSAAGSIRVIRVPRGENVWLPRRRIADAP